MAAAAAAAIAVAEAAERERWLRSTRLMAGMPTDPWNQYWAQGTSSKRKVGGSKPGISGLNGGVTASGATSHVERKHISPRQHPTVKHPEAHEIDDARTK